MACSCNTTPCGCGPVQTLPGCNGRGPDVQQAPSNTPPRVRALACTVVGRIQGAIDRARVVNHRLGFRPYRVRLVWQEQDSVTGKWVENASLELMPVTLDDRESVALIQSAIGTTQDGTVTLRDISPIQVDEWTLKGYRNGQPWCEDRSDREFFYEIQQIPWCTTDPLPPALRFTPSARPDLETESGQWVVTLNNQFGERSPQLVDQTVVGEVYVTNPARLVT